MTTPHRITALTITALALATSAQLTPALGQTVDETLKLLPSDGAQGDYFGGSVSISGTTAIVGAMLDNDNGPLSGSAYLFDATTGAQTAKLLASDGQNFDFFGWSVAVSGTTAIVGASGEDDNGNTSGAAYLFNTSTGTQTAKLSAGDGAAGDYFGVSVAIDGTTSIIGAHRDQDNGLDSGSAYLFDTSTGAQLAKLKPSDGAAADQFGTSVSISGTTALVGAIYDDDNGEDSGSAYLFDTTTGAELSKLLPSDGAIEDLFGESVAISGTIAVVGALWDDDNGTNSGSAYLFDVSNPAAPVEIAKLLPSDGATEMWFGFSVAISGTTAIVGAYADDSNGNTSGSAYIFDTTTGAQLAKLLPTDGAEGDYFSFAIGISDDTVISGARFDDDNGIDSGSAYLFDLAPEPGTSFCSGDGSGTPCPCGNTGAAGEGCANDTGSGAVLSASGSTSIGDDDLVLFSTGLTPGPGLYFQGNNAINSGNGNFFGDGLRCAGGGIVRLEISFSSGGASQTTTSIATAGGVSIGDTKRYQLWYRDAGVSPCSTLFNLTNGYELTWTP